MSSLFQELGATWRSGEREGLQIANCKLQIANLLKVSEAAAEFMRRQAARLREKRTLDEFRVKIWSFFEFLGCDPPQRELPGETPAKFLEWLRRTPIAPRKQRLPKEFSPPAVAGFFQFRPRRKKSDGQLRTEQTVGQYWRTIRPFLEFLGLRTELEDLDRPNLALPPAMVPMRSTIRQWWEDCLASGESPCNRRRVVLTQGLVLCTGMRIKELLSARTIHVEGRFLLIPKTKTHAPRIVYLNRQALAIIAALHPDAAQHLLFEPGRVDRLAGWPHSLSAWHSLVTKCTSPDQRNAQEKRHQALRRKLSDWLEQKDPAAEAAQLGHGANPLAAGPGRNGGGGVVFRHYLDLWRRQAKWLERYRLPVPANFAWPEPVEGVALKQPVRLYAEFRRLVSASRRR